MNDRMFEKPVFVKNRDNIIQEVMCVEDALEFMYDWPKNRRGPIYSTALRACQRAFDSDYPTYAARAAFAAFAKAAKILEEAGTPLPWMMPEASHGGITA